MRFTAARPGEYSSEAASLVYRTAEGGSIVRPVAESGQFRQTGAAETGYAKNDGNHAMATVISAASLPARMSRLFWKNIASPPLVAIWLTCPLECTVEALR